MDEGSAALPDATSDDRTVRLTIPAKPEYITLSRLALTGLARVRPLGPDTLADLKLALTEACSNSVRHAYGEAEGHIEISFELRADSLAIEVADDGAGFELQDPRRPVGDELAEGGLGIAIIRSIADDVELGGGGNGRGSRLRFVKRL